MSDSNIRDIKISELSLDARLQMREWMSQEAVTDYAEHLEDLPPAKVKLDSDGHYWLWDGWHSLEAAKLKNCDAIRREVTQGEFKDAVFAAAGANAAHGVRRTHADKRKTVGVMLGYLREIGDDWADRAIAKACNVGHSLVAEVRKQLAEKSTESNNSSDNSENAESTRRKGSDGKTYAARKQKRGSNKEKKAGNQPKANGAPIVRFENFEEYVGRAKRTLDDLARKYNLVKPSGPVTGDRAFLAFQNQLSQFCKEVKAWCQSYEKKLAATRESTAG